MSRRMVRVAGSSCVLPNAPLAISAALSLVLASGASGQIRVAQWNITNWAAGNVSSRGAAFQRSFYDTTPGGLQFAPDIIVAQEITESSQAVGQANVDAFLRLLNNDGSQGGPTAAPSSPGDWAAAPYVLNAGDTGNALFYRTSKVSLVETRTLNLGTSGSGPPRDNQRWQVRVVGYTGPAADLYLYSAHFKAGSTSSDQTRRNPEAQRIREDANNSTIPPSPTRLPPGARFVLCADYNMRSSAELAYQLLTVYDPNLTFDPRSFPNGQFVDPIRSPGTWYSNAAFRFIHTQEPGPSTGGMDDRFDQILTSTTLLSGQGLAYIYNRGTPSVGDPFGIPAFSTTTWNDPNHTYRCWGNDGLRFNTTIVGNNQQVGDSIATDLVTTAAGNGHLPVYLDLQVPAKLGAPTGTIDFGTVPFNALAQAQIAVTNAADVVRFSKPGTGYGVDALTYTLATTTGFSAPAGSFERAANAGTPQANTHLITLNTSTPGLVTGTLTITSDDPDNPTRTIQLTAFVQAPAQPDYDVNDDGVVNIDDLYAWYALNTDVNGDGTINAADGADLDVVLRSLETPDTTSGRR